LVVALPADERPHLLVRRVAVDVVILDALRRLQRAHPFHERGPRHAERHRLRVVAVDARDGVLDERPGLGVRHGVYLLESLYRVAGPLLDVSRRHGRVAVYARPRLRRSLLAFGVSLIFEHVGVPPLLPEIDGESVPRPHRLETRVLFQPRLRYYRARV